MDWMLGPSLHRAVFIRVEIEDRDSSSSPMARLIIFTLSAYALIASVICLWSFHQSDLDTSTVSRRSRVCLRRFIVLNGMLASLHLSPASSLSPRGNKRNTLYRFTRSSVGHCFVTNKICVHRLTQSGNSCLIDLISASAASLVPQNRALME